MGAFTSSGGERSAARQSTAPAAAERCSRTVCCGPFSKRHAPGCPPADDAASPGGRVHRATASAQARRRRDAIAVPAPRRHRPSPRWFVAAPTGPRAAMGRACSNRRDRIGVFESACSNRRVRIGISKQQRPGRYPFDVVQNEADDGTVLNVASVVGVAPAPSGERLCAQAAVRGHLMPRPARPFETPSFDHSTREASGAEGLAPLVELVARQGVAFQRHRARVLPVRTVVASRSPPPPQAPSHAFASTCVHEEARGSEPSPGSYKQLCETEPRGWSIVHCACQRNGGGLRSLLCRRRKRPGELRTPRSAALNVQYNLRIVCMGMSKE